MRQPAEQYNLGLAQSSHIGEEFVDAAGKTWDAANSPTAYEHWGTQAGNILKNIKTTALKSADYTAVDLKGASKEQIATIRSYVRTLPDKLQKKIRYVY